MERFSGFWRVLFGRVPLGLLVAGLVLAVLAVAVMGGPLSSAAVLLAVALGLLVVKVILLRREQAADDSVAPVDRGGYFDVDIAVGSRRVFAAGGVPASLVSRVLAQAARSVPRPGVPVGWDRESERALGDLMVKDSGAVAGPVGRVTVHRCGDAAVALRRVERPRVPWTPASSRAEAAAAARADVYFAASMASAGGVLGVGVLVAAIVAGSSKELLETVARSLLGLDASAGYPGWLTVVVTIVNVVWVAMTAVLLMATPFILADAIAAYRAEPRLGTRPSRRAPRLLVGVKS